MSGDAAVAIVMAIVTLFLAALWSLGVLI